MTIVRCHALDGLDEVDEIDLLATDPPYAFGGSGDEHAISATIPIVLRECAAKLKRGHWAVIYSASSWRSTEYMVESVRGILDPVRIATWTKPQARSKVRTPGWAWASVNVILFRKGKSSVGNPTDLLDHISCPPVMNGRRAELPKEVAEWSIAPFVTSGLMVDPFAGSGKLLDAAVALGMDALGFEKQDV